MSTDAQKRASTNYNRKQDNIMIRPNKEEGATIRAAAAAAGMSVQAYVLQAVRAWMEGERAGAVPAGSPAVEDRPGVDMVSAGGSQDTDICSRSTSLRAPDSTAGQFDSEPEFIRVMRELSTLSPKERDKRLGTDPEGMERYRQEMERKRQRLAELNTKVGGLSRAEDAERRRLMMECKDDTRQDDSAQE